MPRGAITRRSDTAGAGPGGFPFSGTPVTGQILRFDGAAWVPFTPPPTYFQALAADITQGAGSVDVLTQVVASLGTGLTKVWSSFNIQTAAGTTARLFITVDAATVVSAQIQDAGAAYHVGAIDWAQALAAGNHTVKLVLTVFAGTVYIRPALLPNEEFANLMIQESF